ncbi:unnamed protein product [Caenorhabditis brenneri]
MWLKILTTLLLSTFCAGSDNGVKLTIKELHNQFSPIAKTANDLFLESELLKGRVDLVKEVLGDNLQIFEEYSQIDISNGIPEQIEVLELIDKAEASRTSDEVRKKIEKGFETLDGIKDFKLQNDKFDGILGEFKKVEKNSRLEKKFTQEGRDILKRLVHPFLFFADFVDGRHRNIAQNDRKRHLERAIKYSAEASGTISDFKKYIEGLSIELLSFHPIEVLKSSIGELKPMIDKMKTLENLSQDLTPMETELKVLEELRDSQAPKKIQMLTKKLENTLNQISVEENVHEKYKIETALKLLEKISLFTSFLDTIKWKFAYLKQRWSPTEEYLNNLKISEDISKPFLGLRNCISQHDFSTDSPLYEDELYNATKQFKELYSMQKQFREDFDRLMNFKDLDVYRRRLEVGMKHLEKVNFNDEEWNKFVEETFGDIDKEDSHRIFWALREPYRSAYWSGYEKLIYEAQRITEEIDVQPVTKITEYVKMVIDEIDQFLKCYSDLKVTPESVKSLMDQSIVAWNFDPRPLEGILAVIDLFKDAHKMIGGLTSWKFEQNDVIKNFPLTSEDVTGISEGVEALEAIMKVQRGWDVLRESMEDSDVKDALIKFSEEISHLEPNANLPKLQELISNVHFPNQFNTVIDFYKNRYQGNRRREILKILEGIKTMDFPSYPSKLEKMNQAVGTMRKWAEQQGKIGDQEEEEPWVDCALSTCDHVLTLSETPEDPVPEVSL